MQAQPTEKRKGKSVSYSHWGYLFIAPFFITFLIFGLYPILLTFKTSLSDAVGWEKILNNRIIGLDNFLQLFDPKSPVYGKFWGALGNSVIMWLFNIVPQLGLALILASWFTNSRLQLRGQGFFKTTIFMPNIITATTIGMLFMSFFAYPTGPVNMLIQTAGIASMPIDYFRSVEWSRGLISFIQCWMGCGNTMIIMIAGISGINPSLAEAALMDGCSSWQTFWKITLPLIKPILLYTLTTSLIGGLTMFDLPHIMTQGNPNETTNTVARFIYTEAFTGSRNFNMASAASVVLFVMIILGSLLIRRGLRNRDPKPDMQEEGATE